MVAKPTVARNKAARFPWAWQAVLFSSITLYLYLFFCQPSILGISDSAGNLRSRWFDLLQVFLVDQLLSATAGGGRFQVSFLDRLPILVSGGLWLVLANWIGRELVGRPLKSMQLNLGEKLGLYTLAGMALLSTITFVVGVTGALANRWFLIVGIVLALIALRVGNAMLQRSDLGSDEASSSSDSLGGEIPRQREVVAVATSQIGVWLSRLIPVTTCLLIVLYVLGGLLTPWEFDVVSYHLQAVKEFYQDGMIGFSESNVYANMPLAAEMHSLAWMVLWGGQDAWWWGGLIGKFLIGCYSLLAASLVGGLTARLFNSTWGFAAAGLMLAVPGNEHVAIAGLIDFALAANLFGCVYILLLMGAYRSLRPDAMFIASLLGGAAAACKYPGFVFSALPLAVTAGILCLQANSERKSFGSVALYCARVGLCVFLGLAVTCLPWLLKNVVLTGNPFYPLANAVFPTPGMDADQVQRWNRVHEVPVVDGVRYGVFVAWESIKQVMVSSSFLNPVTWPFALAACILLVVGTADVSESKIRKLSLVFSGLMVLWVFVVWWTATHRIERFWLPAIPFLSLMAAVGAELLARKLSFRFAALLVLFGLGYGLFVGASGAMGDNRFFVALEELRYDKGNDEYQGRVSPATVWLNGSISREKAKVLLVGESRAFDFESQVLAASCFNTNPGEALLLGKNASEQRENLKQAGITHVLVNWAEIARYRGPGNYGFSSWPERNTFQELSETGVLRLIDWSEAPSDTKIYEVVPVETARE